MSPSLSILAVKEALVMGERSGIGLATAKAFLMLDAADETFFLIQSSSITSLPCHPVSGPRR